MLELKKKEKISRLAQVHTCYLTAFNRSSAALEFNGFPFKEIDSTQLQTLK